MLRPIRIATRGSLLALAQANQVMAACRLAFPQRVFELRVFKTTGDRMQKASLSDASGKLPKGLFTKELEVALLSGEADFAVHSLKDLPTELPEGLRLAAVLEREDPRDLLVTRAQGTRGGKASARRVGLDGLAEGAIVATSSTRRVAQLREQRPDLRFVEIRGNVHTRVRKLGADPSLAATVLAVAGLKRLGVTWGEDGRLRIPPDPKLADPIPSMRGSPLDIGAVLPAVGQAAIGLECRSRDPLTAAICRKLNHADTLACVQMERAFLSGFGGGCHSPVAAYAEGAGRGARFRAVAFDGERVWRKEVRVPWKGAVAEARRLGREARKALDS
jgi:hydroxymethylbilane synthase